MKFKSSFACLSLIVSLLAGCATTPQGQIKQLAADARDLAEVGTRLALIENPNHGAKIDLTIAGLKELEALPDPLTVDALVNVLSKLPTSELRGDRAQLLVLSGRIIIRRATGNVELGTLGIRPIVSALREGMESGRGIVLPPVPTPQ